MASIFYNKLLSTLYLLCVFASCNAQFYSEYYNESQIECLKTIAKYIADTSSIKNIQINKKDQIDFVEDSFNYYFFTYNKNKTLRQIQIDLGKGDNQHLYFFNKTGSLSKEFTESQSKKSTTAVIPDKDITYSDSGRIASITERLNDSSKTTDYADDGRSIIRVLRFLHHKQEGSNELFFKNGTPAAIAIYSKGKIVTMTTFEKNGEKVAATKVENGNGYWRLCDEEGGYCCECIVRNGAIKKCNKFGQKKKHIKLKL